MEAEVFLPDHFPAYISLDEFKRNQEQIRLNRSEHHGPVRAGSALLSGLLICGRCGLRMSTNYNNNGQAGRYACTSMQVNYGDPFCQSLVSDPVDKEVSRLVLEVLKPASSEVSIAVANDIKSEREKLERHWSQRLERAQYEVDQARRRYGNAEPENRMVVRALEKDWEAALMAQQRLAGDHDRFKRESPSAPTPAELAAIRDIADDLPALWDAQTTTQAERQSIVRLMLERVIVTVIGDSELVDVECHWHGGNQTKHRIVRSIGRVKSLSTYPALIARVTAIFEQSRSISQVVKTLSAEGWRSPKTHEDYRKEVVRQILIDIGMIPSNARTSTTIPTRGSDEWTIRELAEKIGMPEPTLYSWIRRGQLPRRTVKSGRHDVILVTADENKISELRFIHATPLRLRRGSLKSG
jgi:hypothetical protein